MSKHTVLAQWSSNPWMRSIVYFFFLAKLLIFSHWPFWMHCVSKPQPSWAGVSKVKYSQMLEILQFLWNGTAFSHHIYLFITQVRKKPGIIVIPQLKQKLVLKVFFVLHKVHNRVKGICQFLKSCCFSCLCPDVVKEMFVFFSSC